MTEAVLRRLAGTKQGVVFWCPGCRKVHAVNQTDKVRWFWDGSMDRPTFSPSILVTCRWSETGEGLTDEICHSFVTEGRMQFLADCTHDLRGQTVQLQPWPYEPGKYGGIEE